MVIRLGTRASALALAQSGMVAESITKATGHQVKLVRITTPGDAQAVSVRQLGVGVFVSALRDALHAKEIDVAVHSYKDLPTAFTDGLIVAAVPPREDPRDALISGSGRKLTELPPYTRVGTGAPRRMAQLRALGLGLDVIPIRGNVDTRMGKVASGELDAVVLAQAGLNRLGLGDQVTEIIDSMVMLPAPAQGALAIECRSGDRLADDLAALDDPDTRFSVVCERALLARLEAGCSAPVAGWAQVLDSHGRPRILLRGSVIDPDGARAIRLSATGVPDDAEAIGHRLADDLLAAGAGTILQGARHD